MYNSNIMHSYHANHLSLLNKNPIRCWLESIPRHVQWKVNEGWMFENRNYRTCQRSHTANWSAHMHPTLIWSKTTTQASGVDRIFNWRPCFGKPYPWPSPEVSEPGNRHIEHLLDFELGWNNTQVFKTKFSDCWWKLDFEITHNNIVGEAFLPHLYRALNHLVVPKLEVHGKLNGNLLSK